MKKRAQQYQKLLFYFYFFSFLSTQHNASGYSVLRPYDGSPIIATSWVNKPGRRHYLQASYLEIFPLFKTFDRPYFYRHMLPETPITFRYFPEKTITPKELKEAMNRFFLEVRQGIKKNFSEFTILKNEGFNSRKQAGLIVVRGKEWPLNQFVVKLFMETPRSFIRASNKGFIAVCHFIVGHGCTRYMLGFTRLKNLEMMRKMVNDHAGWKQVIDFPRKWFWIPDDYPWIHLVGYHISGYEKIAIDFPAAYAIVEDAIHVERQFSIKSKEDRDKGVEICNFFECLMDPHSQNFVIEKETGKIVIIDTEHLPTMVALKEPVHIESYPQWYSFLTKKGIHDCFGRTNAERKALHSSYIPPYEGPERYRPQPLPQDGLDCPPVPRREHTGELDREWKKELCKLERVESAILKRIDAYREQEK